MKVWAKLVAYFLIAWLPLLGFPAQAVLCPAAASVAAHQRVNASHMPDVVTCEHGTKHHTVNVSPACHGSTGRQTWN